VTIQKTKNSTPPTAPRNYFCGGGGPTLLGLTLKSQIDQQIKINNQSRFVFILFGFIFLLRRSLHTHTFKNNLLRAPQVTVQYSKNKILIIWPQSLYLLNV
jgi:hypothetical protein